jgi:peptidoglycan-associated lipoprotein
MRLKKLVQIMLVTCTLLSLGACSTAHKRSNEASIADTNNSMSSGAQASGLGDSSSFGGGSQEGMQKHTYYFDFDRSDVHEQDKPAIYANADYLIAHPNAKVTVEGHTDPRGSREYNVALGERRANAVVELLKSKGVNPRQVQVVSYGAERLAAPGHSDSDYQMDRRAVIVYSRR